MLAPTLLAAALLASPPAPHIDVYTMGKGDALFHRFGHAAICVVDDDRAQTASCFNYGTTDFGSPPRELGWSFVRGNSPFWVSVWPLDRMLDVYVAEDRSVWRQRIPLSPAQARAVATKLEADAARYDGEGPEGAYAYHHFEDNCTTRIRDILDQASGGVLSAGADAAPPANAPSYRELGREGLADIALILALDRLFVGRAADRQPSEWAAMFLPRELRASLAERFGARPELIYERRAAPPVGEPRSGVGWLLLLAALVIAPTVAGFWSRRGLRVGLALSGALLSIIGLAIWLLCGLSQMPELRYNEAALVFWPTDLALALLGPARRRSYARIRALSLVALALGLALGLLHQPLLGLIAMVLVPMVLVSLWPAGPKPEAEAGTMSHVPASEQ